MRHSPPQIVFGSDEPENIKKPAPGKQVDAPATIGNLGQAKANNGNNYGNNYARPNGMQNVGNFLTDRPSSRVLAPPGGGSQVLGPV